MIFSKIFPLPFTVRKFSGSIFLIFIVRQQELRSKWMAVSIFRRKGSKRTVGDRRAPRNIKIAFPRGGRCLAPKGARRMRGMAAHSLLFAWSLAENAFHNYGTPHPSAARPPSPRGEGFGNFITELRLSPQIAPRFLPLQKDWRERNFFYEQSIFFL